MLWSLGIQTDLYLKVGLWGPELFSTTAEYFESKTKKIKTTLLSGKLTGFEDSIIACRQYLTRSIRAIQFEVQQSSGPPINHYLINSITEAAY